MENYVSEIERILLTIILTVGGNEKDSQRLGNLFELDRLPSYTVSALQRVNCI